MQELRDEMRQWPAFNHHRDFRGVELLFRVVVRIPVDLDLGQMFDRIVEVLADVVFDRLFVCW